MAMYLITARYEAPGLAGLVKDGGTGRRAAVERALQSLGGRLEGFYFAFGETDAYVLADLPDAEAALALALTVRATGAAHLSTTALVTPEQVDAAAKRTSAYRAPGQ